MRAQRGLRYARQPQSAGTSPPRAEQRDLCVRSVRRHGRLFPSHSRDEGVPHRGDSPSAAGQTASAGRTGRPGLAIGDRRAVGVLLLAQGMGGGDIAAAPDPLIEALRLSARRPGNARTIASLMHAIDRFRRPRPESVLTSAELAAITTPTIFIIGSGDPYLSIERARTSIDQIQGARLYEMPGGHAPWLVDAQHAAELITTHSHLATNPQLIPTPSEGRPEGSGTARR